jgi:5-formyltetrahydrofolate cyclo-ligase
VQVPNVGVCFAEQLLDDLPCEPHDVRVQAVLTA